MFVIYTFVLVGTGVICQSLGQVKLLSKSRRRTASCRKSLSRTELHIMCNVSGKLTIIDSVKVLSHRIRRRTARHGTTHDTRGRIRLKRPLAGIVMNGQFTTSDATQLDRRVKSRRTVWIGYSAIGCVRLSFRTFVFTLSTSLICPECPHSALSVHEP